ncbi:MAG: ABC transporter permease [Cyanobacteria bacterium J06641_5]
MADLSPSDLTYALLPVLLAIALSAWQRLGLEGPLAVAAVRSLLQLAIVGYVLEAVFVLPWPPLVGVVAVGITAIAAALIRYRLAPGVGSLLPTTFGALLASVGLTFCYGMLTLARSTHWANPQIVLPLLGVLLGNAVSCGTIAGERAIAGLERDELDIETHLSLGATPKQATARLRRAAIRAGVLPSLSQMTLAGLLTVPSLTVGQLLGGVAPLTAISYQIIILFLQAFASLGATVAIVDGILQQAFTARAQLSPPRWRG